MPASNLPSPERERERERESSSSVKLIFRTHYTNDKFPIPKIIKIACKKCTIQKMKYVPNGMLLIVCHKQPFQLSYPSRHSLTQYSTVTPRNAPPDASRKYFTLPISTAAEKYDYNLHQYLSSLNSQDCLFNYQQSTRQWAVDNLYEPGYSIVFTALFVLRLYTVFLE